MTLCSRCSKTAWTQQTMFKDLWTLTIGVRCSRKKDSPIFKQMTLCSRCSKSVWVVRGVQNILEQLPTVFKEQWTPTTGVRCSRKKERPWLKQVTLCLRCPRCSRYSEPAWTPANSVQGRVNTYSRSSKFEEKREAIIEICTLVFEVFEVFRFCLNTSNSVQGAVNTYHRSLVFCSRKKGGL